MAVKASNKPMSALIDNVNEVDRLSEIHAQITSTGPGYKHDVQILHKSAIVLLVACWEAFVEDLAREALEFMILEAKDYKVFPKFVLERVASSNTGVNSWNLAGDGWKKALRGNLSGVLNKSTSALNTPRTAQVDDLFKKVIGLENISNSWYWPGRSIKQTNQTLDDLVTLRGSIAHRVKTANSVKKIHVNNSRSFVYRLAVKSNNQVVSYLISRVGAAPWTPVKFRKTS